MRVTLLLLALLPGSLQAQFQDTMTVARILVDVRVTDSFGEPLRDLEAGDLEVFVDDQPAVIESMEWVDDIQLPSLDVLSLGEPSPGGDEPPRHGRLFVLFVQTDFARASARMRGQMKFRQDAEWLLESLQPEDRVAVFSFDSHLKFRSDFTSDKDAVIAAFRQSIRTDQPPPPPVVPSPSLVSRLDRAEMKSVASSEAALIVIANALRHIEGPKSVLLLGWGLGHRAGDTVQMSPLWPAARRALEGARASIFALDTTFADYHDLEIGLQSAAKQTGGFYAKTHEFSQAAVDRLRRTLEGRFELELRAPQSLAPGTHTLQIRTKRRGAIVLAPASVVIR